MSTGQTNLKALKNDLKAWKNAFIEEHGREPSKDDVKATPQIAAKHKLWKELEKVSKQKETSSTQAVTSDPPTTPLPVRRSKPKQSNSNAQGQPSIFKHAKATVTDGTALAAAASANPFSPTKRRPASKVAKPLLSQVDDPFVASPSSSSTTAAEPPNPFAPSTSSPAKKSRHANLFTTPVKSRPRVSETAIVPSLAEMLMSAGEVRSSTRGEMRHGTSPKKLKQLASVARDTPRTKARKRMRGEEVEQTPGDKRRRITKPPSPIPQENDEGVDDDDEIMDLSPVKPPPLKSGKGKAFQAVFEDDLIPSKAKPIKAPQGLFFSGPSKITPSQASVPPPAKGSSKPLKPEPRPRRSTSVSAATESVSTTPDPPSDTPAEGSGIESTFIKRKGKRSLAETEDSASSRSSPPPESTITSLRDEPPLPPGMANPFGLRPPSPLLEQASQTKGKGKWGERKKGRMDKAVMEEDEDGAEDDSTEDVKEVDLRARTGFRRTTSEKQPSQAEGPGASFENDPADRFWVAAAQRPRDGSPPPTEEETLQVDLPDEMKRVLHIESPSKRRTEETIVDGLFKGELAPEKLKRQDVWGAGELYSLEDEDENDWDSEPEGWKGVVEM